MLRLLALVAFFTGVSTVSATNDTVVHNSNALSFTFFTDANCTTSHTATTDQKTLMVAQQQQGCGKDSTVWRKMSCEAIKTDGSGPTKEEEFTAAGCAASTSKGVKAGTEHNGCKMGDVGFYYKATCVAMAAATTTSSANTMGVLSLLGGLAAAWILV